MNPNRQVRGNASPAGFSLVELLVALVIAAAVITVAVAAFGTLVSSPRAGSGEVDVTISGSALQQLFGINGTTVRADVAPSYGQRVLADEMRRLFWEDVRHANAVFCLGRSGRLTHHPLSIPLVGGISGRDVDTPAAFLSLLLGAFSTELSGVFTNYRNVPTTTNASIFIMQPSTTLTNVAVRAIYDIDLVPSSSPTGIYAVVQRYAKGEGETMERVGFYDVFYEQPASTPAFSPLFVFFERKVLLAVSGDAAADPFKKAEKMPFYMIWWPDPTMTTLAPVVTAPGASPQSQYGAMGGRTSYFFVVPMMPPL